MAKETMENFENAAMEVFEATTDVCEAQAEKAKLSNGTKAGIVLVVASILTLVGIKVAPKIKAKIDAKKAAKAFADKATAEVDYEAQRNDRDDFGL